MSSVTGARITSASGCRASGCRGRPSWAGRVKGSRWRWAASATGGRRVTRVVYPSGATLYLYPNRNVVYYVGTQNETLALPRNEIQSLQQSELSMMPEGLLAPLTDQEARDLLYYLSRPGQVPLPGEPKGD